MTAIDDMKKALKSIKEKDQWMVYCWLIWKARNSLVWQHRQPHASAIIHSATRLVQDWKAAASESSGLMPYPISESWQPPDSSTIKINIDGSLDPIRRMAGGGIVARNGEGMILCGLLVPFIGLTDPLIVEAITTLHALQWARRKNWRKIWMESDSSILIGELQHGARAHATEVGNVVRRCKGELPTFSHVFFSHIRRQGNAVADVISRLALTEADQVEWSTEIPRHIALLASSDVR